MLTLSKARTWLTLKLKWQVAVRLGEEWTLSRPKHPRLCC